MAKQRDLPAFREKRKILFGEKTSQERMREAARQFMEAERYDEALEFCQRTEADELARQIAARALESGNSPLYMRAKRVLGEEIGDEEWAQLAAKAEKAGLFSAAYVAYVKAGREPEAARMRSLMPGSGETAQLDGDAAPAESARPDGVAADPG